MYDIDKFHEWVETQSPLALREYMFAQAAWQARGELDAVKIKELESFNKHLGLLNKENLTFICKQKTEIAELTAKLDKAREALFSASKFVDHLNPSSSMTEYLSKALQELDK